MDTIDNRINLLEEKISKMLIIINVLGEKNEYLENLSRCSFCKNVRSLLYCYCCYSKVCEQCNIIKERNGRMGEVEIFIFCRNCL